MEQWYANNTTIKFPLDPFHEANLPNDMLVDMAVTVPNGIDVWLTNLIANDKFVFMSLEATDGSPVGHCIQTNPEISAIIPLIMQADGYGWVVFGPGIREGLREYKDVRIKLDPSVLLSDVPVSNPFELFVDGKAYERPEILNIRGLDYVIAEDKEDSLWLFRDDSKLSGNLNITLFTEKEYSPNYVTDINGIFPDSAGNIDLGITPVGVELTNSIEPVKRKADETVIGLLLRAYNVTDCNDEDNRLKEKLHCHTYYGLTTGLPLDWVNCEEDDICPPFSIYYNGNQNNEGEPPIDPQIYDTNDEFTVLDEGDLAKIDHVFAGWNTEPDGSGDSYNPDDIGTITKNIIMFAQWEEV